MPLIADNVSYAYGAGTSFEQGALDAVSIRVEVGELVLIIGSTGSGKSTLLRLLSGLLAADSGTLSLDGQALTSRTSRGVVGLVFQDAESQLFAESVIDDVEFGPRNLGAVDADARSAALEALLAVGLGADGYASRSPFGLSGGEARRVAIAGVLAMRPRYLLLDEPTAGLDARGRAAVRDSVDAVRDHSGVVVVSHTVEEFLGVADRVVVLSAGAVVFSGPAAGLIDDPLLLDRAGLRAPDVLRIQMEARACGLDVGPFTLDPSVAASHLMDARGRRR